MYLSNNNCWTGKMRDGNKKTIDRGRCFGLYGCFDPDVKV